jgi:hypothetical protein
LEVLNFNISARPGKQMKKKISVLSTGVLSALGNIPFQRRELGGGPCKLGGFHQAFLQASWLQRGNLFPRRLLVIEDTGNTVGPWLQTVSPFPGCLASYSFAGRRN